MMWDSGKQDKDTITKKHSEILKNDHFQKYLDIGKVLTFL